MEVGEVRASRRDPFRLVICAAVAVAVALGLLAAAGGVPAPEAAGEPLVQVVGVRSSFPTGWKRAAYPWGILTVCG